MQKRAKNEVFGHYLEIGASDGQIGGSDGLDFAYHDSRKCFSAFGNSKRPCIINELCIISIIYAKKESKMRSLAIISRLGPQMDLLLNIMIAENVSLHLVMARGHS